MKIIILLAFFTGVFSCTHSTKEKEKQLSESIIEPVKFFPVNAYFKGQLAEINNRGLTPLKYTLVNKHTDSVWLNQEELKTACKEFLHPDIDSSSLIPFFSEKKFLDQTIDAFTYTYDPIGALPDSINIKHWDVYIDPVTGKVRRVYMVKTKGPNQILQLTWLGDKWCKLTTITDLPNGETRIDKEEKITWDFDPL